MGKSFVVFYTAREGSSAIIDGLSHHPDISVPVFEDLDQYRFSKNPSRT
jgi:hypothetical protein